MRVSASSRWAALFMSVCLVAGCTGPRDVTSPPEDESNAQGAEATDPPDGSDVPAGMSEVVVLSCSNDAIVDVTIYDPTTGDTPVARSFDPAVSGEPRNLAMPCSGQKQSGFALRSMFNRDYTRMAVQSNPDGIGYVDEDGRFTAISAAKSGRHPAFTQDGSRLWYLSDKGFSSVKIPDGSDVRSETNSLATDQPAGSYDQGFYLVPYNGASEAPAPVSRSLSWVYSSDGKLQLSVQDSSGVRVSEPGKAQTATSIPWPAAPVECHPRQIIGSQSFLCIGKAAAYRMDLQGQAMTATKLTKNLDDRQLLDGIVSANGEDLLVLVSRPSHGATPRLVYLESLKYSGGDNQSPKEVARVASDNISSLVFAEWRSSAR